MSTERPSRARQRMRFTAPLEALEARALLNGTVDVGAARTPDRGGPTVTVKMGGGDVSDAVNRSRLVLYGQVSSPDVRVDVYATPRRGGPILIGRATPTSGTTDWALSGDFPLADGLYTVQAQAVDVSTGIAGEPTALASTLNIDDVGPRIIAVRLLPRQGRIVLTFRDFGGHRNAGSGLELSATTYPGQYSFAPRTASATDDAYDPRWGTTLVEVAPARPGGLQKVVVTINGGAPIPTGAYRFSVRSPSPLSTDPPPYFYNIHIPDYVWGVKDRAGNPLDGGATSTITPPDSNDFATAFVVQAGRAFRPRGVTPSARA